MTFATYQQLPQGSPNDPRHIRLHCLCPIHHRLTLPFRQYTILASVFDLLDIMVHVLDDQHLIIQQLLLLLAVVRPGPRRRRTFLGDDFETIKHRTVDPCVCVVDSEADISDGLCLLVVVPATDGREDVLHSRGEVWEGLHERDDALALLDLHLRVFNGADLLVDELGKEIGQPRSKTFRQLEEEVLVAVAEVKGVAAETGHNTNTLDGVERYRPVD